MMAQESSAPSISLVDYGEDEEEEDGAHSSDEELLVPRKRVRVQKTEERRVILNNAHLPYTYLLSLSLQNIH